MLKATKLDKTLIIRRFIDDIILISESYTVSIKIIENSLSTFKKHNTKFNINNNVNRELNK